MLSEDGLQERQFLAVGSFVRKLYQYATTDIPIESSGDKQALSRINACSHPFEQRCVIGSPRTQTCRAKFAALRHTRKVMQVMWFFITFLCFPVPVYVCVPLLGRRSRVRVRTLTPGRGFSPPLRVNQLTIKFHVSCPN